MPGEASPDGPATQDGNTRAVRAVALVEAAKGVLVLLAASGLLGLLHHDVHALAATLIRHAHLNPASGYPRIFLDAAANLDDPHLLRLAAGAAAYAVLRLVEAWGLVRGRAWAEMLAAASGAVYLPFELAGLMREVTWHGLLLLGVNLLVVALMLAALARRRRARAGPA